MTRTTIVYRTSKGWSKPYLYSEKARMRKGKFICPRCDAVLFVSPSDQVYCDAVHAKVPTV